MINTLDLRPGDRISHIDGRIMTITENMGEGQWVEAQADGATEAELVHSQDILNLVKTE